MKGKADPPLLKDSEYPPWLWQFVTEKTPDVEKLVAQEQEKAAAEAANPKPGSEIDLLGLLDTRKKLRREHKKEIKDDNFLKAKKK